MQLVVNDELTCFMHLQMISLLNQVSTIRVYQILQGNYFGKDETVPLEVGTANKKDSKGVKMEADAKLGEI